MTQFEFDTVTESRHLGDSPAASIYAGYLHRRWAASGITLGGYMASVMMKVAMQRYPDRHPISMNTFFVNPGTTGPFVVEVETIKASSKGMCSFVIKLKQLKTVDSNTKPLDTLEAYDPQDYVIKNFAVISLSGARPEQGISQLLDPEHIYKPASSIEDMTILAPACEGDVTLRMYQDMNKNDGRLHYAFEFADGRPVDNLAIVYFFDMYMDPFGSLNMKNSPEIRDSWKPTLQYEIQFKKPIKTPLRRAYLSYFVPNLINGRWDMDGCLYGEDGELFATTRHQLRIIPRKKKQETATESKL
ncbi:thioesterase-like superfamily-domain-containing protein [Zychaea mexicana]|uniref:thioesterase-like superfamily-domain-containing protein n=1 Tax=Zychaea mexicana TaxID=64656 RepID=UPI0022FF38F3|nr:thioesterase-like superfamily-domain-containing protein [Zychaea mexicana]KAI9480235.1 thioesterase-like superfamily-domain-containing protein [Zychaea mexicana]